MIKYTNTFTTKGNIIVVLILAVVSWLLECFRLYIVFYAFNVQMDFASIVVILLLANVIGVITLLPGGIGSMEISLTGFFVLFGVPSALAGSIALADRLVSFWAVSVLGIIFSSFYAKDILAEIKNFTMDLKVLENEEK